ncbi:MAG: hypothetical protein Q8Q77_10235 [Phenylobacterium sp.]|nr:hypothetical protein [Phenylobacterium sp.]
MSALAQVGLGQVGAGQAPASAEAPPAAATSLRLPAGTEVEIELVGTLSSATNKLGDRFAIRLAAPISSSGVEVAAAGATGEGEVIDVARAGISGKQGKLIVAARHLDLDGRRVRVRGMSLMVSGKSRVNLATGVMLVPYAAPVAILIKGGEIEIPAGTRTTVRLAEDFQVNASARSEGKTQ